ncbi:MAG: GNAT family N-acetyltransferase [Proteobacteria bacterium]|nr:GNAT family N-acetyltransferase [Pseudomonadota bacterium]
MSQSIEIQMLSALEIFHYSYRFQNHLFILALEEEMNLQNIITDLRVLHSAHIRIIVACRNFDELRNILKVWNHRGCPFEYFTMNADDDAIQKRIVDLEQSLESDNIPVLGLGESKGEKPFSTILDDFVMNLASYLTVDKAFFLSSRPGLVVDDEFVSHTTPQEISGYLKKARHINIGKERLSFFVDQNKQLGVEIVLLEGKTGCLFQEIFTHRGRGSLLTSDYPNVIRKGRITDVMDIALLMKPYIQSGAILPVTEDKLAEEIDLYYVYTVNNSIVAVATLKDYGTAAELAKFSTLPRYQGKGRAKELAENMIRTARDAQKDYIFALSIEPKMFDFFENLGFAECDRHNLPRKWKENYDMTRTSKAFRMEVKSHSS